MEEFEALLKVAGDLNGPDGCPWDKKQTFSTLQPYVLEEAHELLEAVDENDDQKIVEELGDLLYTIVFYGKIAEKEGRFTLKEVIKLEKEKLVRRHPHVFGEQKVNDIEGVIHHWEKVKKEENKNKGRKSAVDGIPKTLPLLAKAQKLLKKVMRSSFPEASVPKEKIDAKTFRDEMFQLIARAEMSDLDAESELRRALSELDQTFRHWETNQ